MAHPAVHSAPNHPQPAAEVTRARAGPVIVRDMDELQRLASWQAILRDQHGIVSRAQAQAHGFSDARVLAQVTAGRWVRPGRGAIATFTGPMTDAARRHAALLTAGLPAALSHVTAARFHGMIDGEWPADERAHVTVPYGHRAAPNEDVEVHRSRAYEHIVVECGGLAVVSRAHTAVDLAVAAPDALSAMRTLIHLSLTGKVLPDQLAAAMEKRRPRRYHQALRDALAYLRDGVRSALESRYALDVELAHGLPRATRQAATAVDSSTVYEDCLYRCPDGEVIVRLDGHAYHLDRGTRLRDRRRGNAAELAGRLRLEYGWEEVTRSPCRTAHEIGRVLRTAGWTGELVQCGQCSTRQIA